MLGILIQLDVRILHIPCCLTKFGVRIHQDQYYLIKLSESRGHINVFFLWESPGRVAHPPPPSVSHGLVHKCVMLFYKLILCLGSKILTFHRINMAVELSILATIISGLSVGAKTINNVKTVNVTLWIHNFLCVTLISERWYMSFIFKIHLF